MAEEKKEGISLDEKYGNTKALTKSGADKNFDRRVDLLRRNGIIRGDAETQVIHESREAAKRFKKGQPVYYYDLGWSVGYVVNLPGDNACFKIQPIAPYKAKTPSAVYVPVEDVRAIDPRYLRKPWGVLS